MKKKVISFYIIIFTIYFSLPMMDSVIEFESLFLLENSLFILSAYLYNMILFLTYDFVYAIIGQVLQVLMFSYIFHKITVDLILYFKGGFSD